MNDRVIFHIDMNNFFATVEGIDRPELSGVPYAVCGDPEMRHGIVLAKDQLAKSCGVKTGEPIFMAKQKCPSLVVIRPHYEKYEEVSRCARAIYETYTDRVESFGIDECWCDMSGNVDMKNAAMLADEIRERIKKLLRVTVSVGVSFNKVFAKLGSDMKKPDATTVITRDNYKDVVWGLPATSLLFVGGATERTLSRYSVDTVGDIANADPKFLSLILGKNGELLYRYANGGDTEPVALAGESDKPKSISKSFTTAKDMVSFDELKALGAYLCDDTVFRLRSVGMLCSTVGITLRYSEMRSVSRQCKLEKPTDVTCDIMNAAMELVRQNYSEGVPVRLLGVQLSDLRSGDDLQLTLESESEQRKKLLEDTVFGLRSKYGVDILRSGVRLTQKK